MNATIREEEVGSANEWKRAAVYSFPYCTKGVLDVQKPLYPVTLKDVAAGDIVEVIAFASARGGFRYSIKADPSCQVEELTNSERLLDTPWDADVSNDKGPWFSMWTSTFFKARVNGTYTFYPFLQKSVFSGNYAVHHQTIVARIVS